MVGFHRALRALALFVLFSTGFVARAHAGSLAYGTLAWQKDTSFASTTEARYRVTVDVANEFTGAAPALFSTVTGVVNLSYTAGGDTLLPDVPLQVMTVNLAERWYLGHGEVQITVPLAALPLAVNVSECCRLSSLAGGSADRQFKLETKIPAGATRSPSFTALPRYVLERGSAFSVTLPVAPVAAQPNHLSLASTAASGLAVASPAGLTLNADTGVLAWTPPAEGLYAVQVIARNDAGSAVPVDFLLDVKPPTTVPTVSFAEGLCGNEYAVYVGHELVLPVTASSTRSDDLVTIQSGALFTDATFAPAQVGATSTSVLRWTPHHQRYSGYASEEPSDRFSMCFQASGRLGSSSFGHCCVTLAFMPQGLRPLTGKIRDFDASHPDFAVADADANALLVAPDLGVDGKPVFSPSADARSVQSAATFASWWADEASPREDDFSLYLGNGTQEDPRIFAFDSGFYHPLDALKQPTDPDPYNRNFTFEGHTAMVYWPGVTLRFESSDDLWVFVNGKLAVDLGGVHPREARFLSLDDLAPSHGLLPGHSYGVDVFYAHRGFHDPILGIELLDTPETGRTPERPVSPEEIDVANRAHVNPDGSVRIMSRGDLEASSAWVDAPVSLARGFRVSFDFQVTPALSRFDLIQGLAVVLADAPGAGSDLHGGLGYAGTRSLAVELDAFLDIENADPLLKHLSVHHVPGGPNSAAGTAELPDVGMAHRDYCDDQFDCRLPLDTHGMWHRLTVDYEVLPGERAGWLRVYYAYSSTQDPIQPALEVQLDPAQLAETFPNGLAHVGFTTGVPYTYRTEVLNGQDVEIPAGVSVDGCPDDDPATACPSVADVDIRNVRLSAPPPSYDFPAGAVCELGTQCASGSCAGGACCAEICDGPCVSCNEAGHVGECVPRAEGAACSDGTQCTKNDACVAGVCVGSNPVECAAKACRTEPSCNPATGLCDDEPLPPLPQFRECDEGPCGKGECYVGYCKYAPGTQGKVCREAAGDCDAVEACDGKSPDCPEDKLVPENTVCHEAECTDGLSYKASLCTGAVAWCPHASLARPCWPYLCGEGAACDDDCSTHDDCATNALCDNGSCRQDVVPPVVVIEGAPAYTRDPQLSLRATASDDRRVVSARLFLNGVRINGVPAPAPDGSITLPPLTLREGDNTIVVQATDTAGNVGGSTVHVVLDTVAPVLAFLSPTPGQAIGTADFGVTVAVRDTLPVSVSIHGAALSTGPGTTHVSTTVNALASGAFLVTASAVDAAGNSSAISETVLVDLAAPDVAVDVPDGAEFGTLPGNLLPVLVTVNDLSATTVSVGGRTYPLARGGGIVGATVPLEPGVGTFVVTVTSEVGKVASIARSIVYDVSGPVGTFVIPSPGSWNGGTVELSLDATDDFTGVESVAFQVDGAATVPAAPAGGATFLATFDTTPLADGTHALSAILRDRVGNVRTVTRDLLVDNGAPTVTVTAPSPYLRGTVQLRANAADLRSGVASVELSVNGVVVATCGGAECAAPFDTTTLPDGPFVASARAVDRAGNAGTSPVVTLKAVNGVPSRFLVRPLEGAAITGTSLGIEVLTDSAYFERAECFLDDASVVVSTAPAFTRSVDLSATLDGASVVKCDVQDRTGYVASESAHVTIRRWTMDVEPSKLNLKARKSSGKLQAEARGLQVESLLGVAAEDLALLVPGGAPVVADSVQASGTGKNFRVTIDFDRAALVASIEAGIAAQRIDPTVPLAVSLVAGTRVVGADLVTLH